MKRKTRSLLLATIAGALIIPLVAPAASARDRDPGLLDTSLGTFDKLFPQLPGFSVPTQQQIADLAQKQLDPNADSENNCPIGTPSPANGPECTSSGFTYFGQFLDHDLTLDSSPPPTAPENVVGDTNNRTLRFDLDSMYAGGPTGSPQFYMADHKHFILTTTAEGVLDLPRSPTGAALINEGRNDENQVISQIMLNFMKLHNTFVDKGMSFADARKTVLLNYQYVILHDFLPETLYPTMRDVTTLQSIRPFLRMLLGAPDKTMLEFSVAAYRFGHSQVRRAYEVNNTSGKVQVFSLTAPDLRGGQVLTAARKIDWGNFFHDLAKPDNLIHANVGRRIDPLISSSLFVLPIPGAEATGSNVLAFRNMSRAGFYGIASGQDVAKALGQPVISPATLNLGPGFETGTPLWYYVLAESSIKAQGRTLGPVGSAIVGGEFVATLMRDPDSILRNNRNFRPDPAIAGPDGKLTLSDLFVASGQATRP